MKIAALTALLITAIPTVASADFEPESPAWSGLSYLVATAREANVDVEIRGDLDWSALNPDTIVMLVAPQVGPGDTLPSLKRFFESGGRMVVADDFRAGFQWLRPFGVHMHNRPGPSTRHVASVRFLPSFRLDEVGGYLGFHDQNASRKPDVVLNHPASLVVADHPPEGLSTQVHGWFGDRARGWLAEVSGRARLLALADSSALINAMLRGFYGNKQLAANVMRFFCYEGEPCKVRLISNLRRVHGSFEASMWPEAAGGPKRRNLRSRLRQFATRISDLLARRELRLLWWALLVVGLAAPVVIASRTGRPLLPPRSGLARHRTRLHNTVRAWLSVADADYRQPARLLAGHLARLVAQSAGGNNTARTVEDTTHGLQQAIESLIRSGRISAQAGQRVGDVVVALREVAGAQPTEVDRQRFTALAAEVEWAEHVLSHTSPTGYDATQRAGAAAPLGR